MQRYAVRFGALSLSNWTTESAQDFSTAPRSREISPWRRTCSIRCPPAGTRSSHPSLALGATPFPRSSLRRPPARRRAPPPPSYPWSPTAPPKAGKLYGHPNPHIYFSPSCAVPRFWLLVSRPHPCGSAPSPGATRVSGDKPLLFFWLRSARSYNVWANKNTMSQLQIAFLERARVPDRVKLEEAVRALGFDLSIDEFYRPFDCEGFLPCVLKGKTSGFEIYFGSPDEALQGFPHLKKVVGSRDCAITFRWGGDMAECACVLIVSAALARTFSAVVYYQDDDLAYSGDQLVQEAKAALQAAESSPRRPLPPPPAPPPKKP